MAQASKNPAVKPLSGRVKRQQITATRTLMENATGFDDWRTHALALDTLEGHDAWKRDPVSPHYQHDMVEQRLTRLRAWRKKRDWSQIIYSLREGLHRNLGNLANPDLYRHAHIGTKQVIDDYTSEVTNLLNYLCDNNIPELAGADKLLFFKNTGHSFGRSALLLSGGANMGMFHMGVLKALWEQKLLPRVISGSSAGSIMGSLICSRVDSELADVFSGKSLDLHVWRRFTLSEMWANKVLMDPGQLEAFLRRNIGEYTFEEAYRRTKRIMNITVSPTDPLHQPRLLNYLTTPHLTLWSAVMASCAVPGLFPPVTLMTKDGHGEYRPYMPSVRWVDGSLKSDLPTRRLAELYNVNHHIVSQTNPHVVPFIGDQTRQEGWVRFLGDVLKSEVQHRSKQALNLTAYGLGQGMLKQVLEHAAAVVEQQYYGDITIHPPFDAMNYLHLVGDMSHQRYREWVLEGERATWPKVAAIRDQTIIGQTLEECIQRIKRQRRKPALASAA
jgi:TAG lipase / steryl ester hydrolase / phospholipase A2 / LPA acyltransferase